ncbi:hypothetical protein ACVMB2_007027 [Sinorhizobium meliloti]
MASLGNETQNWAAPDEAGVRQRIRIEWRAMMFMGGNE